MDRNDTDTRGIKKTSQSESVLGKSHNLSAPGGSFACSQYKRYTSGIIMN